MSFPKPSPIGFNISSSNQPVTQPRGTGNPGYPPSQTMSSQSGYSYPPPSQPGYGRPTPPGYGHPSQPGYGHPSSQPGYGHPPLPSQPGYGHPPPPSQPGYGHPPPSSQPGYGHLTRSSQPANNISSTDTTSHGSENERGDVEEGEDGSRDLKEKVCVGTLALIGGYYAHKIYKKKKKMNKIELPDGTVVTTTEEVFCNNDDEEGYFVDENGIPLDAAKLKEYQKQRQQQQQIVQDECEKRNNIELNCPKCVEQNMTCLSCVHIVATKIIARNRSAKEATGTTSPKQSTRSIGSSSSPGDHSQPPSYYSQPRSLGSLGSPSLPSNNSRPHSFGSPSFPSYSSSPQLPGPGSEAFPQQARGFMPQPPVVSHSISMPQMPMPQPGYGFPR